MADSVITINQLRACLMMAAEQIKKQDSGSDEVERLNQLCDQVDAKYDAILHNLTGQLVTFVDMIRENKK